MTRQGDCQFGKLMTATGCGQRPTSSPASAMRSRGSSSETRTSWDGEPTNEEKRETIDVIKAKVSDRLIALEGRPKLKRTSWRRG